MPMTRLIHDDSQRAAELADVLRALGHPLRLRIVSLLAEHETNVTDIAERLGASQAIVSQQLRILRMSGLVQAARTAGHALYCLAEPQLPSMLECMGQCRHHAARAPEKSVRRAASR